MDAASSWMNFPRMRVRELIPFREEWPVSNYEGNDRDLRQKLESISARVAWHERTTHLR